MTADATELDPYIRYLPETAQNLVRLIGLYETQALLAEYGGTKRYIPKNGASKSPNWSSISNDAFCKLCATYSGETIDLPKLDSITRVTRDLEIVLLTRQGASRSQLVQIYGLTHRQIGNIRRRYRYATQQQLRSCGDMKKILCRTMSYRCCRTAPDIASE